VVKVGKMGGKCMRILYTKTAAADKRAKD